MPGPAAIESNQALEESGEHGEARLAVLVGHLEVGRSGRRRGTHLGAGDGPEAAADPLLCGSFNILILRSRSAKLLSLSRYRHNDNSVGEGDRTTRV